MVQGRRLSGVLVLCACVLGSPPARAQEDVTWVETETMRAGFTRGVLTSVVNALTGETYTSRTPSLDGTGLLWVPDRQVGAQTADGCQSVKTAKGPLFTLHWPDGDDLRMSVETDPLGCDLIIRQSANTRSRGLYGCAWAISGLADDRVTVIIPAASGIALDEHAPVFSRLFDWPSAWEAQMVIIQGPKGGLCIRVDDERYLPKGLKLGHKQGTFALGFRSYNEGPLDARRAVESVAWRVSCYRGDWRVAARRYRKWMQETYDLVPLEERGPTWARDIRCVVTLGGELKPELLQQNRELLTELAARVDPGKTLIYAPGWRRDGYDYNYPDYVAYDSFRELVAHAHQLGFRVMAHTCYICVDAKHPVYEELKPYHVRFSTTGTPYVWEWPWADPPKVINLLHPGSLAWRELFTNRCDQIVRDYGVDAIHLDVSLAIPQAAEARFDGLNTAEGNVQLHQDVLSALPGIALGGEGLNEVTCRHEAFAQVHAALGIRHPPGQPARVADDAGVDCSHPISAFLLQPYTWWYGYLGYPPASSDPLYRAWTRAYENWGVLPTISRPTVEELREPGRDLAVKLREARLVCDHNLRPDLEAATDGHTKCIWRGEDGSRLVYERDEYGGSHAHFTDAEGRRESLYRYLRGRTIFRGAGSIGRWFAYDDRGIYGLDPAKTHLLTAGGRGTGGPHLGALPEDAILDHARWDESKVVFSLRRHESAGRSLLDELSQARIGIVVDGEEGALAKGALFERGTNTSGGISRDSIFCHPPWEPGAGVLGAVFGEWRPRVPGQGKAELVLDLGLRDGAEENEGVRFLVSADGGTLLDEVVRECRWQERRMDLSGHAGRTVRLRLSVTKGPEGTGRFSWALWGQPRIEVQRPPRQIEVDAFLPGRPVAMAGASAAGPARRQGELELQRLKMQLPGTAWLGFRQAAPAELPVDLLEREFEWSPVVAGMPLLAEDRPGYVTASVGEGTAEGQTRPALVTHPPQQGQTYIDYYLGLPRTPARLETAVAIQDGSLSNGITFSVLANGRELWRDTVSGADGWHPVSVDLTEFASQALWLTLCVDPNGAAGYDWARWAEPAIVPAER